MACRGCALQGHRIGPGVTYGELSGQTSPDGARYTSTSPTSTPRSPRSTSYARERGRCLEARPAAARLRPGAQVQPRVQPARRARRHQRHRAGRVHLASTHARLPGGAGLARAERPRAHGPGGDACLTSSSRSAARSSRRAPAARSSPRPRSSSPPRSRRSAWRRPARSSWRSPRAGSPSSRPGCRRASRRPRGACAGRRPRRPSTARARPRARPRASPAGRASRSRAWSWTRRTGAASCSPNAARRGVPSRSSCPRWSPG